MRAMTPAQRARAQAELAGMPSAAEVADARGTLVATLEQRVRTGSPAEAAAARQQSSSISATHAGSGGGESGVVVRVKERWRRIAEACSAGG